MSDERANEPILGDERNAIGAGKAVQSRAPGGLATTAFGLSDIGCQRSVNQDTLGNRIGEFATRTDDLGLLYAIADGMGGHARGEVASAIAIHELFARYYGSDKTQEPQGTLARVLRETNVAVYRAGQAAGSGTMGTTLTTVLLRNNILYVGNIGDSRTYLIRGGKIKQLSHDHSLIGEQVRSGLLTEAQARNSSIRNVITRAVGYREAVEPDTFAFTVQVGDILLLCSDGLHGLIENEELAQYLTTKPLGEATAELVQLARDRGGHDNITALVVRIDEIGAPAAVGDDDQTTESFTLSDDATTPLPTISPGRTDEIIADPVLGDAGDTAATTPTPPIVGAAAAPVPAAAPPPLVPPSAAPPPPTIAPAAPRAAQPQRQARPPIWLFIAIPLLLILLVAGGAFVVVSRRSSISPAVTTVPSTIPAAPTTTVATPAGGAAPIVPLGTPSGAAGGTPSGAVGGAVGAPPATQPTVGANLSSPTTTPGFVQVPQPTTTAGSLGVPSLPRGIGSATAATTSQRVIVSGVILLSDGTTAPQNFPNSWVVAVYDRAELQQRRAGAEPKARGRIGSAPLGVGFTFNLDFQLSAVRQGEERLVLQVQQEGNSRVATTESVVELAVGNGTPTSEHKLGTIRITGFPEESEPGPSQTPRPAGQQEQPARLDISRAGRVE